MQMQRQRCRRLQNPQRHSRLLPRRPQRSLIGLHLLRHMQLMSRPPRLALLMLRALQLWSAPSQHRLRPPPTLRRRPPADQPSQHEVWQQTRSSSRLHLTLPPPQPWPVQSMLHWSQLRLVLRV